MARKSSVLSTSFRTGADSEKWVARRGSRVAPVGTVFVKQTVRVAKGDPSGCGGQFRPATNYRGTVVG